MKLNITSENYFEIAEAVHAFCSLNHHGQSCEMYSILSRSPFRPGPMWSETRVLKENEFYSQINEENVSDIFERLELFLETRG